MKAVIFDGSLCDDDLIVPAHESIVKILDRHGHTVETLKMRNMNITNCTGCFGCWVKTPGICIIDDDGREIPKSMIQNDLVFFLTPVTFGGYSSVLKRGLDRAIPLMLPFFKKIGGEIHHAQRYERFPYLIGVGVLPDRDEEAEEIFSKLVERNQKNICGPGSSSVVVYTHDSWETVESKIEDALGRAGVPL